MSIHVLFAAVLQVQVKSQEKETDIHAKVREARLSLVDLAGSERAAMCEVCLCPTLTLRGPPQRRSLS